MIVYVDASAALKLVVDEEESVAVAEYLEQARGRRDELVSSLLLHTELHCAANRRADDVDLAAVREVLSVVDLLQLDSSDLMTAALLPGRLRTLDAVHLAAALRVNADTMLVYDAELGAAATAAGIRTVSVS